VRGCAGTMPGEESERYKEKASSGRVPGCGIFTNKISPLSVNDDYVLPSMTSPVKGLFIAVPQIEPQLSDAPLANPAKRE
jgi:hypothetical protein